MLPGGLHPKGSGAFGITLPCMFTSILGSDCNKYQRVYQISWKQIIGSQWNNMVLYSSRHKTRGWKPPIISSYCHSMFITQHCRTQSLSLMDVAHNSCFLECIININSIHRASENLSCHTAFMETFKMPLFLSHQWQIFLQFLSFFTLEMRWERMFNWAEGKKRDNGSHWAIPNPTSDAQN